MDEKDFYRAPDSPGSEGAVPVGSPVKAVLVGLAVSFLGGYALRTIIALIATYVATMSLAANLDSDEPATNAQNLGALVVSLSVAANLCMTILAGFVCARLSLNNIWRDTAILIAIAGGVRLAFGLWMDPPLLVAVSTVGTVAALAYGAWLGIRSLKKRKDMHQAGA